MRTALASFLLFFAFATNGYTASAGVRINELVANPANGQKEWIEIFNTSRARVDLTGWKLRDNSGNSYRLEAVNLLPSAFLIVTPTKSRFTLNNDGDTVVLLNANDQAEDSVSYDNAMRGASFARLENKWQWTTRATPSAANELVAKPTVTVKTNSPISTSKKSNGLVTLTGIVTAAPGMIGPKTMYLGAIESTEVSKNMRVDLPLSREHSIKVGNKVKVSGKFRTSAGQIYLAVASMDHTAIESTETTLIEPVAIAELKPSDDVGTLTKAQGKIGRKTSRGFTLIIENLGDIPVTLPPNTKTPFPTSTTVEMVGIYAPSNTGERILVRSLDDLKAEAPTLTEETRPEIVLKKSPPYVLIASIAAIAVAASASYIWWKKRRRKSENLPYEVIDEEEDL